LFSKFDISIQDLENMNNEDLKSFEKHFLEKRYLHYTDEWKRELNLSGGKLCTYRLLKTDFRLEAYLLHVPSKRHRQAMARFRVSSHKLLIELGRHSRPYIPREARTCKFCEQRCLDDEIHFLMKCDFLNPERERLLREITHFANLNDYVLSRPQSAKTTWEIYKYILGL